MDQCRADQVCDLIRKNRRFDTLASAAAVILCPLFLVLGLWIWKTSDTLVPEDQWWKVENFCKSGELGKAVAMGERLVKKMPSSFQAHKDLALVYLARGDLAKAEANFQTAADLFPSRDNLDNLEAIKKRRAAELPSVNQRPP